MQLDLLSYVAAQSEEPTESASTATLPRPIETMADVVAWCEAEGRDRYAKALKRMGRAAFNIDLRTIPATEAELAKLMPATDDNPYPDEYPTSATYKDHRRCAQAALRGALGYYAKKALLRSRKDGWADLLATIKPFCGAGGFLNEKALLTVNALADACRAIDMEPADLCSMDRILELDATANDGNQRDTWRRAITYLTSLQTMIPDVSQYFPGSIISLSFARRTKNGLPDHLEQDIAKFVETASHEGVDRTSGRKHKERSENTQAGYRAALRHFLTTLGKAGIPVAQANDLRSVITDENSIAAVAWLIENQDEPESIGNSTAASYFGSIITVAARNGIDVKEMASTVKLSEYLAIGRAMAKEMCGSTLRICKRVVADPASRQLFFTFHLFFRRRAEAILQNVGGNLADLANEDRRLYIMFGVLAAFCAIQTEGAPERKMSVLKLRVRGLDANIWMPNRLSPLWKIKLSAIDNSKTKTKRPITDVLDEGSATLSWYYDNVRPLLEGSTPSSFMFPGLETQGHIRQQTFDGWIARGTAEAGLRMTAHKFRCVQATLLLDEDWNNLVLAAHLLGNKPKTCQTYYAWINEEELMARSQEVRSKVKARAMPTAEVVYE